MGVSLLKIDEIVVFPLEVLDMKIKKDIMKNSVTGLEEEVWTIWYETSETKPTDAPAVSIAYCYKGSDKGKVFVFDGSTWVEQ